MSQSDAFRIQLIENGCISALVSAVINGRITSLVLAQAVCRCLCLLSYYQKRAEIMIKRYHALLALHAIYRLNYCATNAYICTMTAIILQNYSKAKDVREELVAQDGFKLIVGISKYFTSDYKLTFRATVLFVHNLSLQTSLHTKLVEQGINLFFNLSFIGCCYLMYILLFVVFNFPLLFFEM